MRSLFAQTTICEPHNNSVTILKRKNTQTTCAQLLSLLIILESVKCSSAHSTGAGDRESIDLLDGIAGPPFVKPTFARWLHTRSRIEAIASSALRALNCTRVLGNDRAYIDAFLLSHERVRFEDPPPKWRALPMDCKSIRERHYFPMGGQQGDDGARRFPLAYARIVHKDYVFLELDLASAYSPRNWYCYAVDANATPVFKRRMRKLANCLPNVFLVEGIEIVYGGANMTSAHLRCLERLERENMKWKYVALLQNYDVTIRTNREAVQVYRWLDGANDVEVTPMPSGRVNTSLDWSFEALRLFRNTALNKRGRAPELGFSPKLALAKGSSAMSLTRPMVRFIVRELNLTEFLKRLDQFGADEILFNTLQASDALQAPGAFTHACIEKNVIAGQITRFALWGDDEGKSCGSRHTRHGVCVFGLEDVAPTLAALPHLFVNKLMPEFDFGAAMCWYEEMFRRSRLMSGRRRRRHHHRRRHHRHAKRRRSRDSVARVRAHRQHVYASLPHVRFQKFRRKFADSDVSSSAARTDALGLEHFDCNPSSSKPVVPDAEREKSAPQTRNEAKQPVAAAVSQTQQTNASKIAPPSTLNVHDFLDSDEFWHWS